MRAQLLQVTDAAFMVITALCLWVHRKRIDQLEALLAELAKPKEGA